MPRIKKGRTGETRAALAEEETRLVYVLVHQTHRQPNRAAKPRIRPRPQTACGRCRPWEPTALHDSSGIRYHLAANATATPSLKRGPCHATFLIRRGRRNAVFRRETAFLHGMRLRAWFGEGCAVARFAGRFPVV